METTLMYLTGYDSRLAEDLISALSTLFISFFSAEKEDENETEPITSVQSTGGTPEPGSPGLCPPVNHGPGTVQPGEHAETVRPSRKSIIAWLAGRTHPRDRRGSRHIRIRTFQTPRLCPARDKRITGRSWCCIRTGDFSSCPVISRPYWRSRTSFPSCPYERRERKRRFQGRTALPTACWLYL